MAFWLIRKDLRKEDQWLLVMCGPGQKDEIGFYGSPHDAAYAVAHFKTGNVGWDMMPEIRPDLAERVRRKSNLDVLKSWRRHDEGSP